MRIRRVLTAGIAATALVLAGCSSADDTAATTDPPATGASESSAPLSSGPASDPAETTEATTEATTEESTGESTGESAEMSEETSAAAGAGDVQAFAEALTAANASVTSVKGSAVASLNGGEPLLNVEYSSVLADGVATAMQMTNTTGGAQPITMEILLVDGKYYVGGAQLLQQLGVTSGTWVELDKNSTNPLIAQLAAQMETQSQAQGSAQVAQMVQVAKTVEEVGPEDVEGVPTTHYRLTIDAAKAAELGGASGSAGSAAAAEVGSDVPMDLWVDENGRTVQLSLELEVQGQVMTLAMKMYDYDVPVEITAPAADQIATVPAG